MRKYCLLALFSMVYTASFASQNNTLTFTGYFANSVSNQPLAGVRIGVQAVLHRTWVSIYTGNSGPASDAAAVFSGVTDNNGYLYITGTFNPVDNNGGQYYLVDGGPDRVYYNVSFDHWSTPYTPTGFGPWTSSQIVVGGFSQILYSASLITPQNSNSITFTQNGVNTYLSGRFHDLDSRFPHTITQGTNTFNFNLGAPSIAILPTQNTCSVTIQFGGNATLPLGGTQQSLSVTGYIYFTAQFSYTQLGNGNQILVYFPTDPSLSWVYLTAVSINNVPLSASTYQALFRSTYATSFNNAIAASGFGRYLSLGNPLLTGMFGDLYTELTLPASGTFTTSYNSSNPGLSSFTASFLSRLSFMGTLQ